MSGTAIAIAAHPDDIEFAMAGTLLALKEKGWAIHVFNLSCGNLGSATMDASMTARVRREEARQAAGLLGAECHEPILKDLEIVYDVESMRRVAAVLREIQPGIVLTHSPQDYMEDHMNTCRMAVTAAFTRGMPNFESIPPTTAAPGETAVYHAQPHMNRDPLGELVVPGLFVNVTAFMETKRAALSAHRSQKEWLDRSQGMDSYLKTMEDMNGEVGRLSRRFEYAEGWRQHFHVGYASPDYNPLLNELGDLAWCNLQDSNDPEWPTVIPYP